MLSITWLVQINSQPCYSLITGSSATHMRLWFLLPHESQRALQGDANDCLRLPLPRLLNGLPWSANGKRCSTPCLTRTPALGKIFWRAKLVDFMAPPLQFPKVVGFLVLGGWGGGALTYYFLIFFSFLQSLITVFRFKKST